MKRGHFSDLGIYLGSFGAIYQWSFCAAVKSVSEAYGGCHGGSSVSGAGCGRAQWHRKTHGVFAPLPSIELGLPLNGLILGV